MLLMVEKGIRGGICNPIYWYSKANNKYMKDYNKKRYFSMKISQKTIMKKMMKDIFLKS